MKIKNWIIVLIIIVMALVAVGYYLYKVTLPRVVAKAIVKQEYPAILPHKYENVIHQVSDTVNTRLETLIKSSQASGVTIEQILKAIDEAQEKEVRKAVSILSTTKLKSSNHAFTILIENIHIKAFEPELLRDVFITNVNLSRIEKGLDYIQTHSLLDEMDADLAREILKQLVIQKQEDIINKLKVVK